MAGLSAFGGMRLVGDSASNQPQNPRLLDNWRIVGGIYVPRPGMTPAVLSPLPGGAVKSLVDFQVLPKKLYLATDGCPGISTTIGTSVNWLDTEEKNQYTKGIYEDGTTAPRIMAQFDGRIFLGSGDTLKAFNLIQTPYGVDTFNFSGVQQSETIYKFTGFVISSLCQFDGKLFVGLNGGDGASQIWVWDGLSMLQDVTGIDVPTAMVVWRENLVVGFDTQNLQTRAVGAAPGAYTVHASAGMKTFPQAMVSYRDAVYLGDGATKVWKWDGTTFTSHAIAGSQVVSVGVGFGFLYYGYSGATNKATLGRLDSAGTYIDVHKDMTLVYAGSNFVRTINYYRGNLIVSLNKTANAAQLAVSNGSDTSTWTSVVTGAGDVTSAMVA